MKTSDPITPENRASATFTTFVQAFIVTLLWSSGEEYDDKDASDLSPEALRAVEVDCQDFLKRVEDRFMDCDWDHVPGRRSERCEWSQLAHDYCLTRNDAGAGFWDGDWDATGIAEFLNEQAKWSGRMTPYTGDDGQIEVFKG